jgi:hypothetical protein
MEGPVVLRGKKRTLEGAGQRGMKAVAQAIFIQRFAY